MTAMPQHGDEEVTEQGIVQSVTVVGGGVSGLAAACALADAGYQVRLLERRGYLGGRASSYEHPGTGEVIDNCQHVLLGCCTNLIDLYQRLGVEDRIRWFEKITFIEPGGRRSVLESSGLPAPMHSTLSFLRAHAFSAADKLAIARGLMAFLRGIPEDSPENFSEWLTRHGQPRSAIDRFWKPVLVSALNEEMERISVHYAGQVIRESFLRSPQGGTMGIPSIPLSELYGKAMEYIQARGGEVHLRTSVDGLQWDRNDAAWIVSAGGENYSSDALVLAVSYEGMAKLMPRMPMVPGAEKIARQVAQFEHSPITSVHLWFDREITELPHAVLLDSPLDWMFHKSKLQPRRSAERQGSYVELVISASRSMVTMPQQEIIDMSVEELGRFFPKVREAATLKSAVVKEVRATYSVRPLLDEVRPGPVSPWPNAFLAGDWTASGWPSTMEGGVRSGYLAAEALSRATGRPRPFLKPDLPSTGLMRLLD